ncbi:MULTISPECIES: hypothetical protein [unclassified Streptomyces]|uniref:hypothetical protein n=1 Tax=unclassified Streptomyces TaxID=2593676 RepID=UPI002ED31A4B|nr:hypothetical protein OH827_19635 [Streptomyces sp. NBC_00891]WSY07078.1 hypothetical protein OG464_19635 [Streptomyces sp. NBC_00890]WSZ08705.1 hypothetical protein OG704_19640 [Streptomyces sp. NBC_00869]WSZ23797.1 hypothetical protein OG498_13930 [Streptomyces sp. NBC_00870]
MADAKKDLEIKPEDMHATGEDAGGITTQDMHATGGTVKPLDMHATGGTVKPLDMHATSEPKD